ncbi:HAD-IIB family hydrolase [Paenibacillus radicis (ex Xue et al. 2023)]|uniref:Cof-type HAD-IIB family hydrolase n=1 Tax=Paenibacillus radicis (ex Xue et al. 2023) TaxID=2972489 RepID=A0ABT1YG06_9BACL|nr:HAD family hydrolase [Paenibacillus radicis (ex Xue et al. 2023)]MCR8632126.1 Cof-type HAD-IIB family hydrolase [Paenibacillus radicis (ex Xue et al. 2023)]
MKFVFDLDGTICFKGQPISDRLVQCLEKLIEAGHEVIFASARPIRDMLPVIDEKFHNFCLIGGNGSLVTIDGANVQVNSFSDDQVQAVIGLIQEYQATYLIDSDWDYAYTGPSNHPILNNVDPMKLANSVTLETLKRIVKILILSSTNMERMSEQLVSLDCVVHRHVNENVLDVSPQNIHKWSALQKVGLKGKEFIVFGNDANDISMFKEVLHSVRIGNHTELEKYCTESIPLEGDYETSIICKIGQLSNVYRPKAI